MSRNPNTDCQGNPFSDDVKRKVFQKASPPNQPTTKSDERVDICGALIKEDDYGEMTSDYGWHIDHIKPVSKGGDDNLDNLQALHWENNLRKGEDYPCFYCKTPQDDKKICLDGAEKIDHK